MSINSIGASSQGPPMMRPQQSQNLTEDQKSTISSVLSEYDADSLTEEDAISITSALKDAGIRPGQGLAEAISDEGFDAEEIGSLAAPSQAKGMGGPPPPPPPSGGGMSGLNTDALAELQSILEQYDLENLSSEDESELLAALDESGLFTSGLLFNASA